MLQYERQRARKWAEKNRGSFGERTRHHKEKWHLTAQTGSSHTIPRRLRRDKAMSGWESELVPMAPSDTEGDVEVRVQDDDNAPRIPPGPAPSGRGRDAESVELDAPASVRSYNAVIVDDNLGDSAEEDSRALGSEADDYFGPDEEEDEENSGSAHVPAPAPVPANPEPNERDLYGDADDEDAPVVIEEIRALPPRYPPAVVRNHHGGPHFFPPYATHLANHAHSPDDTYGRNTRRRLNPVQVDEPIFREVRGELPPVQTRVAVPAHIHATGAEAGILNAFLPNAFPRGAEEVAEIHLGDPKPGADTVEGRTDE